MPEMLAIFSHDDPGSALRQIVRYHHAILVATDDQHRFPGRLLLLDQVIKQDNVRALCAQDHFDQVLRDRGQAAGRNEYDIGLQRAEAILVCPAAKVDFDAQQFQQSFIPWQDIADLLAAGNFPGKQYLAAKLFALFEQGHAVTTKCRYSRRLHTGQSATDDDDLLRLILCRIGYIDAGKLATHTGIDDAAGIATSWMAKHVLVNASAAVCQARADILQGAAADLRKNLRVRDSTSTKAYEIGFAIDNDIARHLRVLDPTDRADGYGGMRTHCCRQIRIAALRLIHRGYR